MLIGHLAQRPSCNRLSTLGDDIATAAADGADVNGVTRLWCLMPLGLILLFHSFQSLHLFPECFHSIGVGLDERSFFVCSGGSCIIEAVVFKLQTIVFLYEACHGQCGVGEMSTISIQTDLVLIPAQPAASGVALGRLFNNSEPQFPYL